MQEAARLARREWTRGQVLRTALGGGAAAGGGALLARRGGGAAEAASPSAAQDREILRLFLTLETVHEAFYRAALQHGGLKDGRLAFARAAVAQERAHVALLRRHVGHPSEQPAARFPAAEDADQFAESAIDLEELAIAAYIGQSGNLTREAVRVVAPMVSVEARQAAWIRDLARRIPAPRAADPPSSPGDVLAALRRDGYLR